VLVLCVETERLYVLTEDGHNGYVGLCRVAARPHAVQGSGPAPAARQGGLSMQVRGVFGGGVVGMY
jgi:hypothetical protein